MAWVWIVAITTVVALCGGVLYVRNLRGRVAVLAAEVTTLTSTAAALKAEYDRLGTAPSPDAGVPGCTA